MLKNYNEDWYTINQTVVTNEDWYTINQTVVTLHTETQEFWAENDLFYRFLCDTVRLNGYGEVTFVLEGPHISKVQTALKRAYEKMAYENLISISIKIPEPVMEPENIAFDDNVNMNDDQIQIDTIVDEPQKMIEIETQKPKTRKK